MGMGTPWGTAQTQKTITPGMVEVTTAGHGGIHLDRELNAKVHPAWRIRSGWYEEDSDWAIVAVTFPEHFGQQMPADGRYADKTVAEYAHDVARNWSPDAYEKVLGVTLTGAESYERRGQEIAAAIRDELRSTAAWGHGNDRGGRYRVPDGWVGVVASVGGRRRGRRESDERWFLVPKGEYDTIVDYRAGLLIDPVRHPEWPALPDEDVAAPVTVSIGAAVVPYPKPRKPVEWPLWGFAPNCLGRQVGKLYAYWVGDSIEWWRAYRDGHGASVDAHPTREAAIEAVGLRLAPFAEVPDGAGEVDVAAVFAEMLSA